MNNVSLKVEQRNESPFVILALQGGGALGAFQAGAYQALSEKGYDPDWVAGISIGAVNAAIIAGNKEELRLRRLLKFWEIVAGNLDWWECVPNYSGKLTNLWKVWLSTVGGVSGFFQPNFLPPPFAPRNSPKSCSLYNVEKLKTTLRTLIDFDFLNDYTSPAHVRLSLGATDVFDGIPKTFESFGGPIPANPRSQHAPISIDHILASGANAPWFPGVVIEKRLYWDGGITSNSSLRHILHHLNHLSEIGNRPILIFVIDLWGADDREPKMFDEVCWRIKQIQYSSRIEHDIKHGENFLHRERLENNRAKPGRGAAARMPQIDIVRATYRSDPNEIPFGDALFSRTEIDRRIKDGYTAMISLLENNAHLWSRRTKGQEGVKIHLL
jgi:NTE family protein